MNKFEARSTHEPCWSQDGADVHKHSLDNTHAQRAQSSDTTDSGYASDAQEKSKTPEKHRLHENIKQLGNGPVDGLVDVPVCLLRSNTRVRRVVAHYNIHQSRQGDRTRRNSLLSQQELGRWCQRLPDKLDIEAIEDIKAPVTKESIKELELKAIQNNLALRIDLCFDFELLFQKIGGTKGQEKLQRAELYYELLLLELQAYAHARKPCAACERDPARTQFVLLPSRLESYLDALSKLVEMLVPDSDKEHVVQKLDASHLAREIRIGQLEAEEFSSWLSKLLMSHCAPMRDEMCIQMDEQISTGFKYQILRELVTGLETLLNLLENMKIDIANHQVRTFKLLLITDTVPFLRDCFSKMIKNEQLDLTSSIAWYRGLSAETCPAGNPSVSRFLPGLVAMCSPLECMPSLATFNYDRERLQMLQNEVRDLVQLRTCMMYHLKLATLHKRKVPTPGELRSVSGRVWQIMMSSDDTEVEDNDHLEDISVEIARAVSAAPSAQSRSRLPYINPKPLDLDDVHAGLARFIEERKQPATASVMEQIAEVTHRFFTKFQAMETLPISIEQRNWSNTRSSNGLPLPPEVEDLSRRLAHIGIIHYRVWGDTAYDDGCGND